MPSASGYRGLIENFETAEWNKGRSSRILVSAEPSLDKLLCPIAVDLQVQAKAMRATPPQHLAST